MYKQASSEGREIADARAGVNAYLQSGHEGEDQKKCNCYYSIS